MNLEQIKVGLIDPSPFNPRERVDPDALADLAASIKRIGVLQPVMARAAGARYELAFGGRRLVAAKKAGLKTIPCLVKDMTDEEMASVGLAENLFREDLTDIEKGHWAKALYDRGHSEEETGIIAGVTQGVVSRWLRLLRLPEDLQARVAPSHTGDRERDERQEKGQISPRQAREIARVKDPKLQRKLADKASKEQIAGDDLRHLAKAAEKHPEKRTELLAEDYRPSRDGITVEDRVAAIVDPPQMKRVQRERTDLDTLTEAMKAGAEFAKCLDSDEVRELVAEAAPSVLRKLLPIMRRASAIAEGTATLIEMRLGGRETADLRMA